MQLDLGALSAAASALPFKDPAIVSVIQPVLGQEHIKGTIRSPHGTNVMRSTPQSHLPHVICSRKTSEVSTNSGTPVSSCRVSTDSGTPVASCRNSISSNLSTINLCSPANASVPQVLAANGNYPPGVGWTPVAKQSNASFFVPHSVNSVATIVHTQPAPAPAPSPSNSTSRPFPPGLGFTPKATSCGTPAARLSCVMSPHASPNLLSPAQTATRSFGAGGPTPVAATRSTSSLLERTRSAQLACEDVFPRDLLLFFREFVDRENHGTAAEASFLLPRPGWLKALGSEEMLALAAVKTTAVAKEVLLPPAAVGSSAKPCAGSQPSEARPESTCNTLGHQNCSQPRQKVIAASCNAVSWERWDWEENKAATWAWEAEAQWAWQSGWSQQDMMYSGRTSWHQHNAAAQSARGRGRTKGKGKGNSKGR